jgi:hypothetical protein
MCFKYNSLKNYPMKEDNKENQQSKTEPESKGKKLTLKRESKRSKTSQF